MSGQPLSSSGLQSGQVLPSPGLQAGNDVGISRATWDRLTAAIASPRHPLLFVTISGAHLYGFPSADSDFDLRGVHVLPAREVLGLLPPTDTMEYGSKEDGLELDLVTHDARKFLSLLLKHNGYVLEQLYSPLVLYTTPEHAELKALAEGCITRGHAHHYLGFARTQWKLFEKAPRAKPLLYVYRVLLTGIHLMRTGRIEANLLTLNEEYRLPYIGELLAHKLGGLEKGVLEDADVKFHRHECDRLSSRLESESAASRLSERTAARPALSELLVRLRGL